MRSMPQALLWEMFVRGRWSIPSFFLLGTLLPLLVYGALSGYGIDLADPSFLMMQFTFMPLIIFEFAIGIGLAQGPMARLYTRPMSSHSIVAWHTVSGAVIVGLEMALAASIFNALFHIGWPVWGPAFFAAAAWASIQLLLCVSSMKSFTSFIIAIMPGVTMLVWLQARYSNWFTMPKHAWPELQASEGWTLAGVMIASHFITVVGVNRARCGEQLPSFGIWKKIGNLWEATTARRSTGHTPFRSPAQAQFWYEWRLKGFVLPVIAVSLLTVFGLGEGIALMVEEHSWERIYSTFLSLIGVLSLVTCFVGFFMGLVGNSNTAAERDNAPSDFWGNGRVDGMTSFQGTLPLPDIAIAAPLIKTAVVSVATTWVIWFASLLVVMLAMFLSRHTPEHFFPPDVGILFVPLTLLGLWIVLSNALSISLSGRGIPIFVLGVFGLVGYVIVIDLLKGTLSEASMRVIYSSSLLILCIVVTGFTIWAFNKTLFRKLLTPKILLALAIGAFSVVFGGILLSPSRLPIMVYPAIVAFAELAVLPFATIPLAISWNRHR
jgi:hypothetical protein